MLQAARATKESARLLVRDLDPDAVPLCEALELWKAFVEIGRLAASGATLMARRVEEADAWRKGGHRSAADHMAGESGTTVSETKRQLETSKRVRKLPKTANAMRKGTLSPEKVQAIASAANVDPEAEEKLLDGAETKPLGELRKECLNAKGKDRDKTHARIHRDRYAREFIDAEGAWNLHARGTIEDGARFRAEWQPRIDAQFKLARSEDRHEPHEAYAFDALIELAEGFGFAGEPESADPKPEPDANPNEAKTKPKKRAKRTPAKDLGLIRVDYESLVRGAVEGEETCEIAGLGPIPVRIARALLGDAILKLVITKGVDVVNVTHLGRSVNVWQQVALWWQSRMCQRLGCNRIHRLENDHREDWANTHHTRLDETDRLCGHDHHLKTHCGWALVNGKGRRLMVPPDHPGHPNYRPPQRK